MISEYLSVDVNVIFFNNPLMVFHLPECNMGGQVVCGNRDQVYLYFPGHADVIPLSGWMKSFREGKMSINPN